MNRKELPNKLANLARKIAYRDKVSTNSILEPMLTRQGFDNETYSITVGFDEDLDKVPSKETMEDFDLLDWEEDKMKKEKLILAPYKQDQHKRLSKLMKKQRELESIHLANQKEIQQILDDMHSEEVADVN